METCRAHNSETSNVNKGSIPFLATKIGSNRLQIHRTSNAKVSGSNPLFTNGELAQW